MYLIGTSHPHKIDAQRILERLVSERQRLVTDADAAEQGIERRLIERIISFDSGFDGHPGITRIH